MLPIGARNDVAAWSKIRDSQVLPIMTKVYADVATLETVETADATKDAAARSSYQSSRTTSIIVLVMKLVLALALALALGCWSPVRSCSHWPGCDTSATVSPPAI
jgi:methyl-accepting chemotaxis protein